MKAALWGGLLFFAVEASAETKPDEDVVRGLPEDFSGRVAKHDGRELAKIMADDADFVTVGDDVPPRQGRFSRNSVRGCLAGDLKSQR